MTSHPLRLSKYCYSLADLDPNWNYLLPNEVPILVIAIKKLEAEEKELRLMLKEAAEQSTENMGHDDATQESVRLTLWTLTSKMDYLRDAYLHHTLLKAPDKPLKRMTFGMKAILKGTRTIDIALLGGADLPLPRELLPDGVTGVSYKSPLGRAIIGRKQGSSVELGNNLYIVENISII